MMSLIHILKKRSGQIAINKPIFISGRGQSNMASGALLYEWARINQPAYYKVSWPDVYTFAFNSPDGTRNVTAKNQFEQLSTAYPSHNSGGNNYASLNAVCITAIELQAYFNLPVHYLNYSVGATSLLEGAGDWNVNDEGGLNDISYTHIDSCINLMNTLYGAGNWIYLADLWMQGEGGPRNLTYETVEWDFINALWNRYGNNILFINGKLTQAGATSFDFTYVNVSKYANEAKSNKIKVVDNDNCSKYDQLHYDDAGHFQLGQNFANAIKNKFPL